MTYPENSCRREKALRRNGFLHQKLRRHRRVSPHRRGVHRHTGELRQLLHRVQRELRRPILRHHPFVARQPDRQRLQHLHRRPLRQPAAYLF
nr:MAG TPA: hypothetical protein [Caudoviricetes sp.]